MCWCIKQTERKNRSFCGGTYKLDNQLVVDIKHCVCAYETVSTTSKQLGEYKVCSVHSERDNLTPLWKITTYNTNGS